MTVDWIPHRFAGGVLALDVANTVVLRIDPARRFDRFELATELPRFAKAVFAHRADELTEQDARIKAAEPQRRAVVALRERIDSLFRARAGTEVMAPDLLADMLEECAGALRGRGAGGSPLLSAVAWSALSLLPPERQARIRICDNCGWLFLDRSRNGSRRWCDMAVCGNRRKVSRHYHRQRKAGEGAS